MGNVTEKYWLVKNISKESSHSNVSFENSLSSVRMRTCLGNRIRKKGARNMKKVFRKRVTFNLFLDGQELAVCYFFNIC